MADRVTLFLWRNGIGDPFVYLGDATSTELLTAAQVVGRAADDLMASLALGGEPPEGRRASGMLEDVEGEQTPLSADDVLVTLEWPSDGPLAGPDLDYLHCSPPRPGHLWAASSLLDEAGRFGWRMKIAEEKQRQVQEQRSPIVTDDRKPIVLPGERR